MNKTVTKKEIEGLALLSVCSPFHDYFGTLLDIRGPWTQHMLEEHDEWGCGDTLPGRLAVWEGSCTQTTEVQADGSDWVTYKWAGEYRPLTHQEVMHLVEGRRVLSGEPLPEDGDNLIKIPEELP